MKTPPILISLLFQVLFMFGQNYQIARSDRTTLYGEPQIFAVKIDSFKVIKGDSILYTIPNIYSLFYDEENYRQCYDIFGPTFLGHQIIIQKDGDNLLFNKQKDTITIKATAKLGESWLAFNKPDHPTILATVIEHKLADVLGLMDSIKSIYLTAKDTLSEPLDNLVNDTIEISKHFGVTKTIAFSKFPKSYGRLQMVGYNNPERGIQNLTWFDVHDYQVGDVLHTFYTLNYNEAFQETKTILTILDRKDNINSNGDTESIEYIQKREIHNQSNADYYGTPISGNNAHISDTITKKIYPKPSFDNLPRYPLIVEDYNDVLYAENRMQIGGFNNPPGVISKTPPVLLGQFCLRDSCWTQSCFIDGDQPYNTYYQGLGGPYYSNWINSFTNTTSSKNLVYFEKNDSIWGEPLDLTHVQEYDPLIQINLYPNPAIDCIEVELHPKNLPATFQLFSVS